MVGFNCLMLTSGDYLVELFETALFVKQSSCGMVLTKEMNECMMSSSRQQHDAFVFLLLK